MQAAFYCIVPALPSLQGLIFLMTPITESDRHYMKRALKLASFGLYTTYPNPAVGCVFVRDGRIIGAGWHHKAGQPHAEIMAINNAGCDVKGATAYVTLEPCSHYGRTPPCALRLVHEGVSRVVIAAGDPNPKVSGRGIKILRDAGIEVVEHVFEKEAWFLNRAFMKSITTNVPFVTLKVAMSLDGATALKDGQSKWITDECSRSDVQDLRAQSDVIITSWSTVIADNPLMNVRYEQLPLSVRMKVHENDLRQPLKVIIDSQGRFSKQYTYKRSNYAIFNSGKVLLCVARNVENPELLELDEHVSELLLPQQNGHISLKVLLEYLGSKQYRRCMVEAGSKLTGAFTAQGLFDELYAYIAPKILGNDSRRAFDCTSPSLLKDAEQYVLFSSEKLKADVRLHYVSRSLNERLCAFEEK